MKRFFMSYSRGQSLVFVVFMTFIIIGVMALSIDMGYTYYIRRWAQNTADSAALAAARELCIDTDPVTRYTNAINAATDYAENKNLASGVNYQTITEIKFNVPSIPEWHDASLQPGEVRVDVAINHPNFVAQYFGLDSTTVPARAAAGCFAPGAAFGVIPIAWKCDKTIDGDGYPICDLNFLSDDAVCEYGTDYMYIFFDATDKMYWCNEQGTPPTLEPGVTLIPLICGDDVEAVNTAQPSHKWSWLNLDGAGCDTDELNTWIDDGFTGTLTTHMWVPECEGEKGAVYGHIAPLDDSVIPVFDMICESNDARTDCTDLWHAGIDSEVLPLSPAAKFTYHLNSFAKFRVSCVHAPTGDDCTKAPNLPSVRGALETFNPKGSNPDLKWSSLNSIEGCFIGGFVAGLSGKPSDGVNAGAWSLYLTR